MRFFDMLKCKKKRNCHISKSIYINVIKSTIDCKYLSSKGLVLKLFQWGGKFLRVTSFTLVLYVLKHSDLNSMLKTVLRLSINSFVALWLDSLANWIWLPALLNPIDGHQPNYRTLPYYLNYTSMHCIICSRL